MRFTEEEAKAFGLVQDKDGNWNYPPKVNSSVRDSGEVSKPKRAPRRREPRKETDSPSETSSGGYEISVVSYRHRDTDPDNLCPKGYVDVLVEEGWIPADTARVVSEGVRKKVVVIDKSEQERTEIEIWKIL